MYASVQRLPYVGLRHDNIYLKVASRPGQKYRNYHFCETILLSRSEK